MKFIPDRIRKLFSKKSRKQKIETPAPAAVEAAPAPAPAPVAETPKAKPVPDRTHELAPYKTAEGNYLIDLDVTILGKNNGQFVHMLTSHQTEFQLALVTPQYLSGVKAVATQVEEHMHKTFGLDVGHVFFKRMDANFYFDGYDELLGLPPGNGFQLVLVPEGSNWRPQFAPPPLHAIPGTGTVLQHPVTLLPQFQPQVVYPIMFVNGMDILTPTLPAMPRAPKPEEQKPEEKTAEAVAMPAAAPPPSPPKV
jgi:hypothetical protein